MKKSGLLFIGFIGLFIVSITCTCAFFEELVSPSDVGDFIYKQRDNAVPTITLSAPTNNQTVATNFQVSGSFFDTNNKGDDVKNELKISVIVKSKNNNWSKTFTISRTASIYSANVDVPNYGSYTVYAEASDKSMNKTTSSKINVFVAEIPIVQFITPTSNGNEIIIGSNQSYISGTASIAQSNITEVWLVFSNSSGAFTNLANGTTNWSYTYSSFVEGNNFVYAFAVADNGKTGQLRHINIVVDTQNPVAMIFSPTNNQVLFSSTVSVNGIAIDAGSGIDKTYFILNGETNLLKVNFNNWVTNLVLANDTYVINVYTIDRMGYTNIIGSDISFEVSVGAIYVDQGGNDANPGTKDNPIKTIQNGIELAVSRGLSLVYVKTGTYITNNGLNQSGDGVVITNHNISLVGGWDSTYATNTNHSVLDGKDAIRLIYAGSVTNISISGFDIRNGNADFGGGIHFTNVYNSTISNSTINNNNTTSYDGGGIALQHSSNNIITDTTIAYNYAKRGGGGIFICLSTNNTINANIYSNTGEEASGGVYLHTAYSNTISGNIYGNTANDPAKFGGGGVYLHDSDNNSISGNIFDNTASNSGGGVHLMTGSASNTIDANIYNNTAHTNGGGVYLTDSDHNTINGIISHNIAKGDAYCGGGGVYLINSHLNTIDANIYSNLATVRDGGGMLLYQSHSNTIRGSISSNCSANCSGGGIFVRKCVSNTFTATISYNIVNDNGGGICLYENNYNCLISGTITHNIANNNGGGIYVINSDYNTINGTISHNTANGDGDYKGGGGVYLNSSDHNTIDSTISYNTNTGSGIASGGGGVYLYYSDTNTISGNIHNNSVNDCGGGIALHGSHSTLISNITIQNNYSASHGGGVYLHSANNCIINGNISNNTANANGGGMWVEMSYYTEINAIVSSNFANDKGGGIVLDVGDNNTINGNVYNNFANNNGGGVCIQQGSINNILTGSCIISNNTAGNQGGGVYNDAGAGTQNTNVSTTIIDNVPDQWYDKP